MAHNQHFEIGDPIRFMEGWYANCGGVVRSVRIEVALPNKEETVFAAPDRIRHERQDDLVAIAPEIPEGDDDEG